MTTPSSLCSPRLRPSITSLPQGLQCTEIKAEINVASLYLPHGCSPPLPWVSSPPGKLTLPLLQCSSGTELRGTLPQHPHFCCSVRKGAKPGTGGKEGPRHLGGLHIW